MKYIVKIKLLIITVMCVTGCTTGYWIDRGRDAADIFTVAAGYGVGVQVRVGHLAPGIGGHFSKIGLEDGEFFWGYETEAKYESIFVLGFHESGNGGTHVQRYKHYDSLSLFGILMIGASDPRGSLPFATQLEITVGLGPSVRLGFNPAELLDFLLGWFNLDPADDDLERRKIENKNPG